jgi:hypothetical protein
MLQPSKSKRSHANNAHCNDQNSNRDCNHQQDHNYQNNQDSRNLKQPAMQPPLFNMLSAAKGRKPPTTTHDQPF